MLHFKTDLWAQQLLHSPCKGFTPQTRGSIVAACSSKRQVSTCPWSTATCACDPRSVPFSPDTLFSSTAPDSKSTRTVSVCPCETAMVRAVALAIQPGRLRSTWYSSRIKQNNSIARRKRTRMRNLKRRFCGSGLRDTKVGGVSLEENGFQATRQHDIVIAWPTVRDSEQLKPSSILRRMSQEYKNTFLEERINSSGAATSDAPSGRTNGGAYLEDLECKLRVRNEKEGVRTANGVDEAPAGSRYRRE